MCLVLLYLGDERTEDAEQVILAANRDEFFDRPTSPARTYVDPASSFRKSITSERVGPKLKVRTRAELAYGWACGAGCISDGDFSPLSLFFSVSRSTASS